MNQLTVTVIGCGRAGTSFGLALEAAGWAVSTLQHHAPLGDVASACDLVLLCVPDRAITEVSGLISPGRAVIAHCAGSLGLEAIAPIHERRAAVHPLMTLPGGPRGAELLRGAWFAVAGDAIASEVVDALEGRHFSVRDADRAAYHAAAAISSNHLVAILGQVARIADDIGVPLDAFLALARASLDNVAMLGPGAALTGPAARGDWETIDAHRRALDPSELGGYNAGVDLARRLAETHAANERS